jgi:hypothetical protein
MRECFHGDDVCPPRAVFHVRRVAHEPLGRVQCRSRRANMQMRNEVAKCEVRRAGGGARNKISNAPAALVRWASRTQVQRAVPRKTRVCRSAWKRTRGVGVCILPMSWRNHVIHASEAVRGQLLARHAAARRPGRDLCGTRQSDACACRAVMYQ